MCTSSPIRSSVSTSPSGADSAPQAALPPAARYSRPDLVQREPSRSADLDRLRPSGLAGARRQIGEHPTDLQVHLRSDRQTADKIEINTDELSPAVERPFSVGCPVGRSRSITGSTNLRPRLRASTSAQGARRSIFGTQGERDDRPRRSFGSLVSPYRRRARRPERTSSNGTLRQRLSGAFRGGFPVPRPGVVWDP